MALLQGLNRNEFVLRQQIRLHFLDADLRRDGLGGRCVVARQHYRCDAECLEFRHRCTR